jgi:hypothetical protein
LAPQQAFACSQHSLSVRQQADVFEQQAFSVLQHADPWSQQPGFDSVWQQALSVPQQASFCSQQLLAAVEVVESAAQLTAAARALSANTAAADL